MSEREEDREGPTNVLQYELFIYLGGKLRTDCYLPLLSAVVRFPVSSSMEGSCVLHTLTHTRRYNHSNSDTSLVWGMVVKYRTLEGQYRHSVIADRWYHYY